MAARLVLFLPFAIACSSSQFFGDTLVVDLCSSSFPPGAWMVAFYSPNSGHCKSMRSGYISAAVELAATCKEAQLGAVDCLQNPSVCQQFALNGYPTIKVFLDGAEVMDYISGRDKASIVGFVKDQMAANGIQCSKGRFSGTSSAGEASKLQNVFGEFSRNLEAILAGKRRSKFNVETLENHCEYIGLTSELRLYTWFWEIVGEDDFPIDRFTELWGGPKLERLKLGLLSGTNHPVDKTGVVLLPATHTVLLPRYSSKAKLRQALMTLIR